MDGDPLVESIPFGEHYFRWIADELSLYNGADHYALLHQLYCKPYYWIHDGDAKLAEDSLENRAYYKSIWHDNLPDDMPINVLEVLSFLSMKLANMITDHDYKLWFWELMRNLKLDMFSDMDYVTYGGSEVIDYRLAVWLTRRYSPNGSGGLFPIFGLSFFIGRGHDHYIDQTKLSTYEQSVAYVRNNYCMLDWVEDYYKTYSDRIEEDYLWQSLTE